MILQRMSRSNLQIYSHYQLISKILGGIRIIIFSTSRNIMTDREARLEKTGG
ncbi:30S ribosomal protein S8, chloroplastic [Apostasia shenzhenica]|uniref:Small ribosomal subunit protein uS8c n=1 Tax=Apostasia shenzhenica TaxID=1088818 RepID=A0A2I0A5D4_9ASPA|nr:30S ribosomal protein S8, chloroplastic [Apostasia shenzhenica]